MAAAKRLAAEQGLVGRRGGGARLTGYIKPEIVTVYIMRETLHEVISAGRLRNDERGNVEILESFWGPGIQSADQDTVHPILIYADLMATGDRRNIETAKMIYDREITRLIGKD